MLHIALLGHTQGFHARQFAGIFNTVEWADHARSHNFAPMPASARITRVWDREMADARKLAADFAIDQICDSPEQAMDGADALILGANGSAAECSLAMQAIERRIPCFIDKPLAYDLDEAQRIIAAARARQAPMFTGSALRFSSELQAVRQALQDQGGVQLALASAPSGKITYYAIHPLELMVSVMGIDIIGVEVTGTPLEHVLRINWAGGRAGIISADRRARALAAMMHTPREMHWVRPVDSKYYYHQQMRMLVQMALDHGVPVPWEETLKILQTLDAAEKLAAGAIG